ncbi:hypothetical protein BE20_24900 [Sorangium cellulosum]|uniref:Phage tail protein n=1 Tax=Sorangium cellulosum TaxID=56 RepID=A0A150SA04_SORCE|nr:hypothetical protein BE20_24900 [Sorangium cellulosum]KYF89279.1 hypothetical protein BE18_22870 [Sorangium cellulosum]
MANLDLYTKAQVYVNSALLAEEASVTIKRSTGAQQVKTVAKGFAGLSPGSPMCEITVSNAVPSADFELDPGQFMKDLEVVEVTIFAAGRTATSKGFITDDNFSHAVDTASKLDFTFVGQFPEWD